MTLKPPGYLPPSFAYDYRTRAEAKYDAHKQMHDDDACPEDCLICDEIEDKREARRQHLTKLLKKRREQK